jgi:hypothetical protein
MAHSVFLQIWLPDTAEVRREVRSPSFGAFVQVTLEASIQGYLNSRLEGTALEDGRWPTVSVSGIIEAQS